MSILTQEMIKRLEQTEYLGEIIEIIISGIDEGLYTKEEMEHDLEAVLWLAYVYINYDEYKYYVLAEKLMRKVKDEGEKNAIWCYRYANTQLFQKKFDKALKYSKMATEADPEYPWGWLILARMYYKFDKREEAFAAIEKGLELVPGDYEFTTLKNEIENNVSFSRVIDHAIDEEYDKSRVIEEDRLEKLDKEIENYKKIYANSTKPKC